MGASGIAPQKESLGDRGHMRRMWECTPPPPMFRVERRRTPITYFLPQNDARSWVNAPTVVGYLGLQRNRSDRSVMRLPCLSTYAHFLSMTTTG